MRPRHRLVAVLLAAGEGRRLGYPKAALTLRGRWTLPGLVSALRQGGAGRVALVLSEASRQAIAALGDPGADTVVLNPAPEQGRTGSLLCALQEITAEPDALLVHPCDVPLLSGTAVATLVRAWEQQAQADQLVARLVTAAGRGGHPLLVGGARIPTLRAFAPEQSLRELVHEDPARLLNVRYLEDPGPFLDVDTPEQAALLESLLATGGSGPPA